MLKSHEKDRANTGGKKAESKGADGRKLEKKGRDIDLEDQPADPCHFIRLSVNKMLS